MKNQRYKIKDRLWLCGNCGCTFEEFEFIWDHLKQENHQDIIVYQRQKERVGVKQK